MNEIRWKIVSFDQLSVLEWHDTVALREAVFIVEQNCVYQDVDGKDPEAYHLLGIQHEKVIATTRIFPPDQSGFVIIGRVCNSFLSRGAGVGREAMKRSLEFSSERWPEASVKISAQTYLLAFYSSFGFHPVGDEYLEDGIPHITMTLVKG